MYKNTIIFIFGVSVGSALTYKIISEQKQDMLENKTTNISKINNQTTLNKVIIKEKVITKYIFKENNTSNTINKISKINKFKKLIKNSNYDSAFDIYIQKMASTEIKAYDKFLFKHINNLINTNIQEAQTLIQRINQYTYDNFYYIYLYMFVNYKLNNIQVAFDQIVNIKNNYIPNDFENIVNNNFKTISQLYYEKIKNSNNIETINDFMYKLESIGIYTYSNSLKQKITSINKLKQFDIQFSQKIKLIKYNKHYLVPIIINDNLKLNLLLDTGATTTSIKSEYLNNISYEIVKKDMVFHTANGDIKSDIIKVNSFKIADILLNDFEISTMYDYKSLKSDGLLGQNFLAKFDWKIDQENDILFLNKK